MSAVTGMWALPMLAAQAVWVRLSTPRLQEAPAPHRGTTVGGGLLPDRPYRLAVLGESTAAGVGVASHDDGLVGNLATEIALRTGRTVAWSVVGRTGATIADVSERLLLELVAAMPAGPWHLAVVVVGVNDVLGRTDPDEWTRHLSAVVDDLSGRAQRIAVTGVPPFDQFPALPRSLAHYLAARGRALDRASQQVAATRPRVRWVDTSVTMEPQFFSADRFHPSALGYQRWAQVIADIVVATPRATAETEFEPPRSQSVRRGATG
jgi:lysophospholipase L1-like esterase